MRSRTGRTPKAAPSAYRPGSADDGDDAHPPGCVVIDTLRLTAEKAMALLERGDVSAGELHAAYVDAIAARDGELHAYLRVVDEPDGDGVPVAFKDLISTRGV